MFGQIFICYRRDDTAYVTGYINDRLCEEFGAESVFTDVDNIALGVDFRTVLDETVGQCQIFLAVIGEHWLTARNSDGVLRLQDPSDFVRIEIESALQRNIPVIPLLVGGIKMPSKDELPDSLQDLAFRNGTLIRPAPDFHGDIDRLVHSLQQHLRTQSDEPEFEKREDDAAEAVHEVSPEQDRMPAENKLGREEEDRHESPEAIMKPEDEDRARRLTELRRSRRKTTWAAFVFRPSIVVGLLILAGASWYIDFEYRQQFNEAIAALKAMQGTTLDDEAGINADAAAQDQSNADAIAVALPEVDAPTEPQGEADPVAEVQPAADAQVESQDELAGKTQPETDGSAEIQPGPDALAEAEPEADTVAKIQHAVEPVTEAEPERVASVIISEGVSLAALGDHAAAIENYDEAIQLGADSGFAYRQRGASYFALGDYAAAIKDFSEALRLNAEDVNAYYSRGNSYHASGDYEAAIMDYDEAIRLNAEDADMYETRAASHVALGNNEAAERDLEVAANIRSKRNDSQ